MTADEIRRCIALLIYFGVVHVGGPEELEYEAPLPWSLGLHNPSLHKVSLVTGLVSPVHKGQAHQMGYQTLGAGG